MNRIFKIGRMFSIPDGTKVSPFINPLDTNETELAPELLSGMSIAAGEIGPGSASKIHIHPIVSQVTWVIDGDVQVKMKGPRDSSPYVLDLQPQQAVFTEPRTFFQLINTSGTAPARVLYLVTPAYVFEMDEGHVIYDDAVILDQDWPQLTKDSWKPQPFANLKDIARKRDEAINRITKRKQ